MLAIVLAFLLGALAVLLVQRLFLSTKTPPATRLSSTAVVSEPSVLMHEAWDIGDDPFLATESTKKGMMWIVAKEDDDDDVEEVEEEEEEEVEEDDDEEEENVSHNGTPEGSLHEQKIKNNALEVVPIMKYAEVRSHKLFLFDLDGSQSSIELLDCTVVAVSASMQSTHKWAKKYPIKLHKENAIIYNGSKTCYLYVDSSWEKESWCRTLRLAACTDKEKLHSYAQLKEEFYYYLASISAEHPLLFNPSALHDDVTSKTATVEERSLRAHRLLKRLAKKRSKNGSGHKVHRNKGDKLLAMHDPLAINGNVKHSQNEHSGSFCDEGVLCWNLLLTRLFFDAKRSSEAKSVLKDYFQRIVSNLRTPSYIGGISCTRADLEDLPPYIHNMRAVPKDFDEVCAIEADVEYSGGLSFEVEVTPGVYATKPQKDNIKDIFETTIDRVKASDLLDGLENHGVKKVSRTLMNSTENAEGDKLEGCKKVSSSDSEWENLMHNTSEHVLKVPLSLIVRIASLKGTLCLHVKQPPSDRLWFGFTTMPEISLTIEPEIGDTSDGNSEIALLISNLLKVSIRETLVFPNSECICLPWITTDKDDWIPQEFVPYMGINKEAMGTAGFDALNASPEEARKKLDGNDGENIPTSSHLINKVEASTLTCPDDITETQESMLCVHEEAIHKVDGDTSSNASPNGVLADKVEASSSPCSNGKFEEAEHILHAQRSWELLPEFLVSQRSQQTPAMEEYTPPPLKVFLKPKITDKKARIMSLGKKVGEKLEGKRRHFEEKRKQLFKK